MRLTKLQRLQIGQIRRNKYYSSDAKRWLTVLVKHGVVAAEQARIEGCRKRRKA